MYLFLLGNALTKRAAAHAAGRFLLCGVLFAFWEAGFPGVGGLVFVLDGDGHADVGEVLLQRDDVLVEQTDAALAGAASDGVLVIGAAVDADAAVAWRIKPEEPVPVGLDVATAVLEVVAPR